VKLEPGVDRPRGGQYAIGALVILILAVLAYGWRAGWF